MLVPLPPLPLILTGIALVLIGSNTAANADGSLPLLLHQISVFVLAIFVGFQVVWSVTAALHTPLMSVTNAISGIIIVGGIGQLSGSVTSNAALWLGIAAIFFATLNIAGGFLVTQRMLKMFKK